MLGTGVLKTLDTPAWATPPLSVIYTPRLTQIGCFRWESFTSASAALQPGQVPVPIALDFACPSQPPVQHLARPLY